MKSRVLGATWLGGIMLFSSLSAVAQIPGLTPKKAWDLSGYVKYMATASYPVQGNNTRDHLLHQRFNYEYRFNPELRFNAGMRNRLIWGDSAEDPVYPERVGLDPGYMDLSENWQESRGTVGNSQLDRLYLTWKRGDWLASGGRFRINWGMTTIWNPNDIFNAYSVYDFDYGERPGTDAVMISRKLDFASGLDLVFSPDDESELNSYAGRYLLNHNGWDIQLIGGKSGLDGILGVGFAGDIEGAGFRGELSHFEPTRKRWNGVDTESSTISSIEVDYSFAGSRNWIVRGTVLHITNPQEAYNTSALIVQPTSTRALSFSRLTGYSEVSFDTSPLNRITVSGIYYQDKSVYFSLSSRYSLSDNWQLMGMIQRFDGERDSVFGLAASTLIHAQVRWNFEIR